MKSPRLNEIDLLRFIAALMVVLYHYAFRGYIADEMTILPYPWLAPYAQYGYLGVQLFFMISGFVIFMTAQNNDWRHFLVSRITRLYPAYWIATVLTFIVVVLLGQEYPYYQGASFSQLLVNMTMLQEFLNVPHITGVYWSLSLEIHFYLFVLLLLYLRQSHHNELFILVWLLTVLTVQIWPSYKLKHFFLEPYAANFICGAICFHIWQKGLSVRRGIMLTLAWLLALYKEHIRANFFTAEYGVYHDPHTAAALVTLFVAGMLWIALRPLQGHQQQPSKLCALLGSLTYPLYLLHENIGLLIFNRLYGHLNVHLIFWGTLLLMLAMSYALYRWVERPVAPRLRRALQGQIKPAIAR